MGCSGTVMRFYFLTVIYLCLTWPSGIGLDVNLVEMHHFLWQSQLVCKVMIVVKQLGSLFTINARSETTGQSVKILSNYCECKDGLKPSNELLCELCFTLAVVGYMPLPLARSHSTKPCFPITVDSYVNEMGLALLLGSF